MNLVGLKRRGFSRETINDLRSSYRLLFAPRKGPSRSAWRTWRAVFAASPEVSEIVDFIRADASRPLYLPTA